MQRRTLGAITGAAVIALAVPTMTEAQEFVSIGTGGVTGVYYPTGGAICRMMNRNRADHGIRCSVESTGGSVYNINTLRSGELEFGVAQSDWQYHALHGTSEFEPQGPFEDIRAVFSIHPEPFTVVALNDSGIETFADVKGKRVNIGNPGSGTRATAEVVLDAYGMTVDDLSLAGELKGSEMAQALCDGKMDAIVYVIGHPAAAINEASTTCDVHLVDVSGAPIEQLVEKNPYYRTAVIPGGMYRGSDEDTETFGVGATLVSSADVSEEAVYNLVKAVFDNFDDFKQLHPAFADLQEEEMISEALSAPLHPGAEKYYTERGWM